MENKKMWFEKTRKFGKKDLILDYVVSGFVILFIYVPLLIVISSCCGCAMLYQTEAEIPSNPTTSKFVPKQNEPSVKIWPDKIEIKMTVRNYTNFAYSDESDASVRYKYFKEEKEVCTYSRSKGLGGLKVQAELYIDPANSKDKLPAYIYLNEAGKVVLVRIQSIGEFECPFDYSEMSGSLCQKAEDKYKYFCVPTRMNCEAIVEEILLKEPAEWL